MATVALLGLNGCGGNTGSSTTGASTSSSPSTGSSVSSSSTSPSTSSSSTSSSAKDILVGKTLYSAYSCNNGYEKNVYTSETLTYFYYGASGELVDKNTNPVDYNSKKFTSCTLTEDSKSITATCQDPKQNGTIWKTLADAQANSSPCNNTGASTSSSSTSASTGSSAGASTSSSSTSPSTGSSAKDILVGKTLYSVDSCDNTSWKGVYASETATASYYGASGGLMSESTNPVDYTKEFASCTLTEDSKSITATCQDPKQNGIGWKTFADAQANPKPCNNTGASTSPSVN